MVKRGLILPQLGVSVINVFWLSVQQKRPCGCCPHRLLHRRCNPVRFPWSCPFWTYEPQLRADLDVFFQRLFGQVDLREKRTVAYRLLRSVFHLRPADRRSMAAVFRAVVSVQDNRNTVVLSHLVNVMRQR